MGGYLSQEKIDEIREASDIVDIISEYIPIKKRGKNYTGLCPFHAEKKPSFSVSPTKQFYHCFGCGASGNVITFVMNYESVSFIEAVEILADKCGIKFEKKSADDNDKIKQEILEINDFAFNFFKKRLMEASAKDAVSYLKKRGIKKTTIEDFGIGYAPPGWDNLLNAAQKKGLSKKKLESSGLIVKNEKSNYYDRFRKRIIFTFYNSTGKKIGFAGRTLGDETPKYLNISETPLYKKRYTLYGLYQAKEEIRKLDKCLVVEGYMDLLTLYQAGFKNTVAISGTSLTDEQARLLRKYTRNIYVSFDADRAGKEATLRGISIFINNGLIPYIISIFGGKDPDEIIRKEGNDTFQKLIDGAEHFIDFKMRYLLTKYNINNTSEKTKIVKEIQKTLGYINDITERQLWLNKVAKKLALDETIFIESGRKTKIKEQFTPSVLSLNQMCYDLACLVSMKPDKYNEVVDLFTAENLFDDTTKNILDYIEERIKKNQEVNAANVIDFINTREEKERISALIFNVKEENVLKMLNQYMKRIMTEGLKARWTKTKEEIHQKQGQNVTVKDLLKKQQNIVDTLKTIGGNIDKEKRVQD